MPTWIYYVLIIGVIAFCVPLALGLIAASRQRPSRHDRTLEHIEDLEKQLGMGGSDELTDSGRATPPREQIEGERAHGRQPRDRS